MVLQLRAHDAFAEDWSFVPGTHLGQLITPATLAAADPTLSSTL